MAIKTSGSISLQDIQNEFGGSHPISLSEYYKNANTGYVTPNNTAVPNVGAAIKFNDFYGKERAALMRYYLVAGGGGGGYGMDDRSGSGRAGNGGNSTITIAGTTYTASGGQGGRNGAVHRFDQVWFNANISDGYYKDFGSSAGITGNNSSASAGSGYAAGGSGGGGDAPGLFDRSGNAGEGGRAGQQITGEFYGTNGQSISYSLGAGGAKGTGPTNGADGRPGAIVLLQDGVEVLYTGSGSSYTIST